MRNAGGGEILWRDYGNRGGLAVVHPVTVVLILLAFGSTILGMMFRKGYWFDRRPIRDIWESISKKEMTPRRKAKVGGTVMYVVAIVLAAIPLIICIAMMNPQILAMFILAELILFLLAFWITNNMPSKL